MFSVTTNFFQDILDKTHGINSLHDFFQSQYEMFNKVLYSLFYHNIFITINIYHFIIFYAIFNLPSRYNNKKFTDR